MKFTDYMDSVKDVPVSDKLKYTIAVMWLHPGRLPLGVVALGDETMPVIKIPARARNTFGHEGEKHIVPVIAFSGKAFRGRTHITDIILPSSIGGFPAGAFADCENLRNITIPKRVGIIRQDTFAGCTNLENIYYEGSPEDWKKIRIVHQKHEVEFGKTFPGTPVHRIESERWMHIPGNDPLFSANIHFNCQIGDIPCPEFHIRTGGKDISDAFRIV